MTTTPDGSGAAGQLNWLSMKLVSKPEDVDYVNAHGHQHLLMADVPLFLLGVMFQFHLLRNHLLSLTGAAGAVEASNNRSYSS